MEASELSISPQVRTLNILVDGALERRSVGENILLRRMTVEVDKQLEQLPIFLFEALHEVQDILDFYYVLAFGANRGLLLIVEPV